MSEIEEFVAEPNIFGVSKSHRLRWFGHVERMGNDCGLKKAYLGWPTGCQPMGIDLDIDGVIEADLGDIGAHLTNKWKEVT